MTYNEKRVKSVWVQWGVAKKFGIGFTVDRHQFNLDLGPFWFALEW